MSILDDAIREHLELKRAHGADDAELKRLEDEAFGPPARPDEVDPFAEAPTEFLAAETAEEAEAPAEEGPRRINVADLQEAPSPQPEADEESAPVEAGPSTEERHAIAEQPTELFDVEADIEPEEPAAEAPSPSDEEIVDNEVSAPRLSPVEAPEEEPALDEAEEEEGDDDFWNEQRLSEELDQALEAPNAGEHAVPGFTDELELPEQGTGEEEEVAETEEPPPAEPAASHEEGEELEPDYDPDTGHEDVLEDTPDFLEDAPEDDDLWFEQRPPKDFDFDD